MKAEDAKKLADHALTQLAEALRQGKSEALTRYLATLAKFHSYSFRNVLLILSQRPDASHVAGFHTWRSLGRFVKKGEKGIVITAPMMLRKKGEGSGDAPKASESTEQERDASFLRFRGVYVFDVTQTDGEPLPEPDQVRGDPGSHLTAIKSAITARGITLDHDDVPPGALGVSRGGRISVRSGLDPAQEFSVLAHELAHELIHRGEDRPSSKTVRETEAEAVAFVVCQSVGLSTGNAASDYIQMFDGDEKTLAASLDRVQKVAAEIIREAKTKSESEPA